MCVCVCVCVFLQISDWWVQWAYLECRQPLTVHSNPAISLPKRDFTDWRGQLVYVTARIYTHPNKHPYRASIDFKTNRRSDRDITRRFLEPAVAILAACHSQIIENGQSGGWSWLLKPRPHNTTAAAIHLSLKWPRP